MKRLYSCFNFWKKNIVVFENKKFGKGCFKPSEHMLYLIFPRCPIMVGGVIRHSLSSFCPGYAYLWVVVVKNVRGLLDHGALKPAVSQESDLIK